MKPWPGIVLYISGQGGRTGSDGGIHVVTCGRPPRTSSDIVSNIPCRIDPRPRAPSCWFVCFVYLYISNGRSLHSATMSGRHMVLLTGGCVAPAGGALIGTDHTILLRTMYTKSEKLAVLNGCNMTLRPCDYYVPNLPLCPCWPGPVRFRDARRPMAIQFLFLFFLSLPPCKDHI